MKPVRYWAVRDQEYMSSCFYTHLLVEAVHGHLALRNENDLLPSTLSDKRIPWPICLWISPPRITASLLPEHVNPSRRSIHLYFSSFPRPHDSGLRTGFSHPAFPALTSKVVQSHRRPAREGPNSSKYSKEFLPAPVPYTRMGWSSTVQKASSSSNSAADIARAYPSRSTRK